MARRAIWSVLALVLAAGLVLCQAADLARADSPGQPSITKVVATDSYTVQVSWYNSADGAYGGTECVSDCETFLRFDIRYHKQGDTSDSAYTYIGPGIDFQNSPTLHVIHDDVGEPSFEGTGSYNVTGLSADTTYCFAMRSGALETPVLVFGGTAYDAWSDFSAEKCVHTPAAPTPVPLFGPVATPTPISIDLSFLPALATKLAVILSPSINQVVTGDVLINVLREQQDKDDGIFDLDWAYLAGGNWQTPATSPFLQLNKSDSPNGVAVPNSVFTSTFQCGTQAAPCEFRTWRVRAHVNGVTDYQGQPIWSDWTQFRVCALPLSPSGTVCKQG
jgi:hypothetical protein